MLFSLCLARAFGALQGLCGSLWFSLTFLDHFLLLTYEPTWLAGQSLNITLKLRSLESDFQSFFSQIFKRQTVVDSAQCQMCTPSSNQLWWGRWCKRWWGMSKAIVGGKGWHLYSRLSETVILRFGRSPGCNTQPLTTVSAWGDLVCLLPFQWSQSLSNPKIPEPSWRCSLPA